MEEAGTSPFSGTSFGKESVLQPHASSEEVLVVRLYPLEKYPRDKTE